MENYYVQTVQSLLSLKNSLLAWLMEEERSSVLRHIEENINRCYRQLEELRRNDPGRTGS